MGRCLPERLALCRYGDLGFLAIDNNAADRAMRRVVIGRRHWLFSGNDAFWQHHGVLWSRIASTEAHGVDPQRYLTSVLSKIGAASISELEQFLPEVAGGDEHRRIDRSGWTDHSDGGVGFRPCRTRKPAGSAMNCAAGERRIGCQASAGRRDSARPRISGQRG